MNKIPTIIFITYIISCNGNFMGRWNVMTHHSVEIVPINYFRLMNRREVTANPNNHSKTPTHTDGYVETSEKPLLSGSIAVRKLVTKSNNTMEQKNIFDHQNQTDLPISEHPAWKLIENEDEGCGESNGDRIIGGTDAALGQYPWIALLGYQNEGDDELMFQCGGSLISSQYVLTAAHCVAGLQNSLKLVRLGEYDKSQVIDCVNGVCAAPVQDINVVKSIVNEKFDEPALANDIALLRLEHPVNYNGWVSPICLPHSVSDDNDSGTVEIAGWGISNMTTQNMPNILQTLKIPLVPIYTCKNIYKSTQLDDRQICAGGYIGEDSCSGDSGGPLMRVEIGTGTPEYYLIGIVSFGSSMCGGRSPAVYVNVDHYLKWILDRIEP